MMAAAPGGTLTMEQLLLWDFILEAALDYFATPPGYYGRWTPIEARCVPPLYVARPA